MMLPLKQLYGRGKYPLQLQISHHRPPLLPMPLQLLLFMQWPLLLMRRRRSRTRIALEICNPEITHPLGCANNHFDAVYVFAAVPISGLVRPVLLRCFSFANPWNTRGSDAFNSLQRAGTGHFPEATRCFMGSVA